MLRLKPDKASSEENDGRGCSVFSELQPAKRQPANAGGLAQKVCVEGPLGQQVF